MTCKTATTLYWTERINPTLVKTMALFGPEVLESLYREEMSYQFAALSIWIPFRDRK